MKKDEEIDAFVKTNAFRYSFMVNGSFFVNKKYLNFFLYFRQMKYLAVAMLLKDYFRCGVNKETKIANDKWNDFLLLLFGK